jgi:L-alanine-DL-glutamate epimerase-like enolase superfamily enzyme
VKLHLEAIRAPLRGPFRAGHGAVSERELLLVTLEAADGLTGYGEAAPLASYDGTTLHEVRAALEGCRAILAGADRAPPPQVIARCAEVVLLPPALAALDLALWDLAGRRVGMPAWRLLGDAVAAPEPVRVNWTLTAADRSGAVEEAARARAAGFDTLKAKVAIGDDHGRLAAIRAFAGTDMLIRIDANGAWTPVQARAALRALEPIGIELCEEPVAGVEGIRALAVDTDIPLALDESAADPAALPERACALMCLKISRCGGLSGLLETARRARAAGYEVFLASTLDGPLGIAAALHAAAVLRPQRASGLATLAMFAGREDPLPPSAGRIAVPSRPGLGDGLTGWYRAGR